VRATASRLYGSAAAAAGNRAVREALGVRDHCEPAKALSSQGRQFVDRAQVLDRLNRRVTYPPPWSTHPWVVPGQQPALGDQQHLLQPGRAGLPQHLRQPAGAAHDDVAAEDADLEAVVRPGREVRGELSVI